MQEQLYRGKMVKARKKKAIQMTSREGKEKREKMKEYLALVVSKASTTAFHYALVFTVLCAHVAVFTVRILHSRFWYVRGRLQTITQSTCQLHF